jgi:hypothetical protein
MREELSKDMLETLWQDEEFVLSRSVQKGELSPVLVVTPALAQPAPATLTRLQHAYALRDELDGARGRAAPGADASPGAADTPAR